MNGYDWPDYESAYDWPDWGDAEFFPSPGLSVAKGLINRARAGQRPPSVVSRPGLRPPAVAGQVPPILRDELSRVYETMKRLEQKQDEQTRQLALLQVRASGQQTGEVFRQALTTGVLNAVPAWKERDLWTGLAQFIPAVQAWQGVGPSVATKPLSTLAFPLVTALALFFLRKPAAPKITSDIYTGVKTTKKATITLEPRLGLKLIFDTGAGPQPYTGPFQWGKPGPITAKAVTPLGIESDQSLIVLA